MLADVTQTILIVRRFGFLCPAVFWEGRSESLEQHVVRKQHKLQCSFLFFCMVAESCPHQHYPRKYATSP